MERRLNRFFDKWLKANTDYATRHDGIPTAGGDETYKVNIKAMDDYWRTYLPVHLLMQFIDYGLLEEAIKRNPRARTSMTMMLLEFEAARRLGDMHSRRALLGSSTRA